MTQKHHQLNRRHKPNKSSCLRRWHRRLGYASALFVFILVITGLLLNHTEDLQLDQKMISQSWLYSVYGADPPHVTAYNVNGQWISQLNGETLFFNETGLTSCNSGLKGAIFSESTIVIACADELILVTANGTLIEKITSIHGLPQPVSALGYCNGAPCLASHASLYSLDLEQLLWKEIKNTPKTDWTQKEDLPVELQNSLNSEFFGSGLNWERLLIDIHSGRILGQAGVWLVDIAALIFLIISLSGLWIGLKRNKQKQPI